MTEREGIVIPFEDGEALRHSQLECKRKEKGKTDLWLNPLLIFPYSAPLCNKNSSSWFVYVWEVLGCASGNVSAFRLNFALNWQSIKMNCRLEQTFLSLVFPPHNFRSLCVTSSGCSYDSNLLFFHSCRFRPLSARRAEKKFFLPPSPRLGYS